ncbi:uncharacterized protein NEMAJ01_0024 [Nematocida major]|uniref:uncharacterized protein n=1 Tax=Nematocida major TaxID=1912982 RepID=UPI002008198B|nr:uncharacterized protein NEMAJ01_0024 [Nematocida major]KAH9385128.1 hypothetical protein NEMAJ01_0024 [Nematocida major]
MPTNKCAVCAYKHKSKKKWMDGSVVLENARLALLDTRGREIDSVRISKIQLEDEVIPMEYHEVLCEDGEEAGAIMQKVHEACKSAEKPAEKSPGLQKEAHCGGVPPETSRKVLEIVEQVVRQPANPRPANTKEDLLRMFK